MDNSLDEVSNFNAMTPAQQRLFALFDALQIPHATYRHAPIFTVEEGLALDLPGKIPGLHGKSLFLVTHDGTYWLVVASETTRVNLKELSGRLGTKRFSFAKPETMLEMLGVVPGSATPFALMNDCEKQVNVAIDETFLQHELCVFHPLQNIYSTAIPVKGLLHFMDHLGYVPHVLAVA